MREVGTKMPSDFGGIIYLSMTNRKNLLAVKRGLKRFLNDIFTADLKKILKDD
jgi:hypothetical protein